MNDKEIRATIAEYIKELAKINNNANKAYTLSKTVANFMKSQEFQTWAAQNQEDPLIAKFDTAYSKFVQRIMQFELL